MEGQVPERPGQAEPTELIHRLMSWASGLRFDDVPAHTVALARSQIISDLAAVRASREHPLGRRIVAAYGSPFDGDARQTAHVLAALAMCLEYDEVAYSGHPSASCVNVALAYAGQGRLDGRRLVTSVVAANECATRFQAGMLLGSFFRGQSATYTHLLGTVVARLCAEEHAGRDRAAVWEDAAGLAFGILPAPVENAFLKSDAKVLVAAVPVRMALDACDAALAGLAGPRDVLEGPEGVLRRLSDVPMPEAVVAGLGRRWHTDTLSFKRYPASAYLQAAFECAERIAARTGTLDPHDVTAVRVDGSILTWLLEQKTAPFLAKADTATAALTFSAGYGMATILLTGSLTPADLAGEGLRDPARWALADKVEVRHDKELTRRMVTATVPLGEALRQAGPQAMEVPGIAAFGDEARELLAELGPPSESFTDATMAIGARVEVALRDGTVLAEELDRSTGMAGPETRETHEELAAAKFEASGGRADVLRDLLRLDELDAGTAAAAVTRALM